MLMNFCVFIGIVLVCGCIGKNMVWDFINNFSFNCFSLF